MQTDAHKTGTYMQTDTRARCHGDMYRGHIQTDTCAHMHMDAHTDTDTQAHLRRCWESCLLLTGTGLLTWGGMRCPVHTVCP